MTTRRRKAPFRRFLAWDGRFRPSAAQAAHDQPEAPQWHS